MNNLPIWHWEKLYPSISWREPVRVSWAVENSNDFRQTYACRTCIANKGLNKRSEHQWPSVEEAQAHINEQHLSRMQQ